MGLPNERQFLALAGYRMSHLFAYLPRQSRYDYETQPWPIRGPAVAIRSRLTTGCTPARGRRFGKPDSGPRRGFPLSECRDG